MTCLERTQKLILKLACIEWVKEEGYIYEHCHDINDSDFVLKFSTPYETHYVYIKSKLYNEISIIEFIKSLV